MREDSHIIFKRWLDLRDRNRWFFAVVYGFIGVIFICAASWIDRMVTDAFNKQVLENEICIVIDPGHGGEDGGAVSCTGIKESTINLDISKRLNLLLQLMGYQTKILRESDTALYISGNTISEKKVSDLKERVRLINEEKYPLLLSIHQNQFSDSRYNGAQVFYAKGSESFARNMQSLLVNSLNKGSNRKAKSANGIYIMEHISCPALLIECGFLSNQAEEYKLRSSDYQNKLAMVIAAAASQYIYNSELDRVI